MSQLPQIRNPKERLQAIEVSLDSRLEELQKLIPKGSPLDPERLRPLVISALLEDPGLLECSERSLINSVRRACKMGLEPSGPLGHAYIVKYRNTRSGGYDAQLITGYKGWLFLSLRSQAIKEARARVVYRQEIEAGLVEIQEEPPKVVHKRDLTMDRSGWRDEDIIGSYFTATLASGGKVLVVLSRSELDTLERLSKQGWKSNERWPNRYKGMARKSAILAAYNRGEMPIDRIFAEQIAAEQDETLVPVEATVVDSQPSPSMPTVTGSEEFAPAPSGSEPLPQREDPEDLVPAFDPDPEKDIKGVPPFGDQTGLPF